MRLKVIQLALENNYGEYCIFLCELCYTKNLLF